LNFLFICFLLCITNRVYLPQCTNSKKTPHTQYKIKTFHKLLLVLGAYTLVRGYLRAFVVKDNYSFVTNLRLCVRGKKELGSPIVRDIPISSIINAKPGRTYYGRGNIPKSIYVKLRFEEYKVHVDDVDKMIDAPRTAKFPRQ